MGDRMDSRVAGVTLPAEALRCHRAMNAALPIGQCVAGPVDSSVLTLLAHSLSLHDQSKCVSVLTLIRKRCTHETH